MPCTACPFRAKAAVAPSTAPCAPSVPTNCLEYHHPPALHTYTACTHTHIPCAGNVLLPPTGWFRASLRAGRLLRSLPLEGGRPLRHQGGGDARRNPHVPHLVHRTYADAGPHVDQHCRGGSAPGDQPSVPGARKAVSPPIPPRRPAPAAPHEPPPLPRYCRLSGGSGRAGARDGPVQPEGAEQTFPRQHGRLDCQSALHGDIRVDLILGPSFAVQTIGAASTHSPCVPITSAAVYGA
eukprot:scaffold969_cov106-Isochrysis_galbana.AAC.1